MPKMPRYSYRLLLLMLVIASSAVSPCYAEGIFKFFQVKKNVPTADQQEKKTEVLREAAASGNAQKVENLLKQGANIDAQGKEGWTPLTKAAYLGHAAVVEQLLLYHAGINIPDKYGNTPLMCSAAGGHANIVKTLIDSRASINKQNDEDRTALMHASKDGHLKVVETLVGYGAEVNAKDVNGWTPLLLAAKDGHLKVVETLIAHGAEVNTKNADGWSALLLAARYGHFKVVEELVAHDAEVNVQNAQNDTALMWAARCGDLRTIQQLIAHHARIDTQNFNGCTALIAAASYGHLKILELLIAHGANVDHQDINGRGALMDAAKHGQARVVEALIAHGADVNMSDNDDMTPLMFTLIENHLDTAQHLLNHGALADADALQKLFKRAQKAEHLGLLKSLLPRFSEQEVLAHLLKAYSTEQWWTMLAMLTLQPQLAKAVKKISAQHQAMIMAGEDRASLPALMQQLEQLSAGALYNMVPAVERMASYIKRVNDYVAATIQDGMESTGPGVVPIELAQMITAYTPGVDATPFRKKSKKHKKSSWLPAPELVIVLGSLLAQGNPTAEAREQQQATPLRA